MQTPFITPALLRTALSPTTYLAIFDDDGTNNVAYVDASDAVKLCISRAHVRVVSYLGNIYNRIPDGADADIPGLLADAELNYATGIAFDRHPEYVRTFGESERRKAAFDQADMTMKAVRGAMLSITDVPSLEKAANVGGVVIDGGVRVFLPSPDGTTNSGDF